MTFFWKKLEKYQTICFVTDCLVDIEVCFPKIKTKAIEKMLLIT